MELSSLNTKEPAEKGAFLHLKHPVLKHLMYSGKNVNDHGLWDGNGKEPEKVGVTVRGSEAPSVKNAVKELRRQQMKSQRKREGRNTDDDDISREEIDDRRALELVCSLVTEFHNITSKGRVLDGSNLEDKILFFSQSENLVQQVTVFASEATNFFGKGSGS